MNQPLTVAMALGLTLAPLAPLAAQEKHEFFGPEHRRQIYESNKKSHVEATLWTAVFPGLGNFYAESYLLGGIFGMVMVFGTTIFAYGVATDQSDIMLWGGIGMGGAYLGSGITANFAVMDFNAELRRGLKVGEFEPASGPVLSIRF